MPSISYLFIVEIVEQANILIIIDKQ